MENVYTEMLALPLNEQAKYIRGFVDGEGGARAHAPGEPHVRALDVSNSDRKATVDSWRLKILDKESITKFAELIGFSDPKKRDILQQIIASYRELGS